MKIEFETDNDVFEEYGVVYAIDKILKDIVDKVGIDKTSDIILDINGNKIGEWEM